MVSGHGHEAGLALSVPIANRMTFGGTVKYFRLSGIDAFDGATGGVTFDVGTTITVLPKLSVAVGRHNLRDLHNSNATQGVGYGIALIPIQDLVIVADGFDQLHARQRDRVQGDQRDGGRGPDIGREGSTCGSGVDTTPRPGTTTRRPAFRGVGGRRDRRRHQPGHRRSRGLAARDGGGHQPSAVYPVPAAHASVIGNLMTATLSEQRGGHTALEDGRPS